jgi:hypothetical protein
MTLMTFIVPVRHQANANDWPSLKARLTQTMASIAGQSHHDWRAVIVANEGADLPEVPSQFSVVRVNFPPNPFYDLNEANREQVYDAVRLDKGRRILSGMLSARDTAFFMVVDDDDFVSANIVAHVAKHRDADGWKISKGYLWSEGGRFVLHQNDFSNVCGTSHIIRADLYGLPASVEEADPEYVKSMLGSHVMIANILADAGHPLAPLPFRGAIYRVGHSGAHSKSGSLLRAHFLNRWALQHPRHLLSNLTKLRMLDDHLRREFFGVNAGKRRG